MLRSLVGSEMCIRDRSRFDLQKILVHEVKPANIWLKTINSQALLASLVNVESAFTKFFREKTGFPNFKSRKNPVQSFQLPQHYTIDFESNTIKPVSYTHLRAHETPEHLVCRL